MKHIAVDDQQSRRTTVDVTISPEAMRQSDLLGFAFTDEQAGPGGDALVQPGQRPLGLRKRLFAEQALKQDWHFKSFVMAAWGAVHSTSDAANSGHARADTCRVPFWQAAHDLPLAVELTLPAMHWNAVQKRE